MFSRFHTIPTCYGQTDGQMDGQTELLYQYRAIKILRLLTVNAFNTGFIHSVHVAELE